MLMDYLKDVGLKKRFVTVPHMLAGILIVAMSAAPAVALAEGLKLTGISPTPVTESASPQRLILKGNGFSEKSLVALSRAGKVAVLPGSQVEYLNNTTLGIEVITAKLPGEWAVQVGSEDNRHSNVLYFQVVQASNTAATPRSTKENEKLPTQPTATMDKSRHAAMSKNVQLGQGQILGVEWLDRQPKGNYTLQLLVSSSRYNLTHFARMHKGLDGPLAAYAFDKDGNRLQVLTMGSYSSREEAMQAASTLPAGVKGWPRSLASVQQVMLPESLPPQGEALSANTNATSAQYKDTAWAWSQDPSHYTVQLAAAKSEKSLESVMASINLPGELAVVQTLREGELWYVLIYGSFASREAATGTIERLPARLKQSQPWPRSFASIQGELSKATPR